MEDNSPLKISNVVSLAGEPQSEANVDKSSAKVHSAMSAENLPPLELSKRLQIRVEKYVNLLKRYQERNVKERPLREQDVRLTNIKKKTISLKQFNEYYKDSTEEGSKPSTQTEEPSKSSGNSPDVHDSESSSEADDTDHDEDYEPDDEQDQVEIDLALQTKT